MAHQATRFRVTKEETSWAWWLLPIFFAWIGGVIGWLAIRQDDGDKARRVLWLGIGLTVVWIILMIAAAASAPAE